jgi:hypothetical protein
LPSPPLSLSFLRTFPVLAQGFHAIISLANANGGIAALHPISARKE